MNSLYPRESESKKCLKKISACHQYQKRNRERKKVWSGVVIRFENRRPQSTLVYPSSNLARLLVEGIRARLMTK